MMNKFIELRTRATHCGRTKLIISNAPKNYVIIDINAQALHH